MGCTVLEQGDLQLPNNAIPDRLYKQHGRWISETAKDGYMLSLS